MPGSTPAPLLQAYTRIFAEARPRAFLLENVYALTYNNKASRPAYQRLLREITDAGYAYQAKVLNAADYGVPQARPRLFIVGVPKGTRLPELPGPSHTGKWERRISGAGCPMSPQAKPLLVLTEPETGEEVCGQYGRAARIPPGDNYLYYTEQRGHPNRCSLGAAGTGRSC